MNSNSKSHSDILLSIITQDTEEESSFRQKYAHELLRKKQRGGGNYYGLDELTERECW